MMKFSKDVASSEYDAIANDSLKDEDNGVWLVGFPRGIQIIWLQHFYWIRWVDRLAEQDQLVRPGGKKFGLFYQAWKRLLKTGKLDPRDQGWPVLQQIAACWFEPSSHHLHQLEIEAWGCYVDAVRDYHQRSLTIATVQDYETMLTRLAGACFQCLPFLETHHRAIAGGFGVVDQFYNNLRDLHEDAARGLCYFPNELLDRFGVRRQEILDHSCFVNPGYRRLMSFWINDYLSELRQQQQSLVIQPDLHPAWQCLVAWFLHRYARIEKVMQACQYNFVTFSSQYWQAVRQDLRQQTAAVQPGVLMKPAMTPLSPLESSHSWDAQPAGVGSKTNSLMPQRA